MPTPHEPPHTGLPVMFRRAGKTAKLHHHESGKCIMRTPKGKKYFSSEVQAEQYRKQIKLAPCPHCGLIGCLIRHGYLHGYADGKADEKALRGYRFSVHVR